MWNDSHLRVRLLENQNANLNPTFRINDRVEQHTRKKNSQILTLRFWVRDDVKFLFGFNSYVIVIEYRKNYQYRYTKCT